FGNRKPPLAVMMIPSPCRSFQAARAPRILPSHALDESPDGDMISSCPAAFRSIRRSGLAEEIFIRSSSLMLITTDRSRVKGSTSHMVRNQLLDTDATRGITSEF